MGKIKRWLKDSGTTLITIIGLAIVAFALVVVGILAVEEKKSREKAEAYKHQLIAFCAAVDHADIPGVDIYVMKDPYGLLPLSSKEKPITLVVFKKDEPFRRLYAIYSDGQVIYSGRSPNGSEIKGDEDWGNHPRFSNIGEK